MEYTIIHSISWKENVKLISIIPPLNVGLKSDKTVVNWLEKGFKSTIKSCKIVRRFENKVVMSSYKSENVQHELEKTTN